MAHQCSQEARIVRIEEETKGMASDITEIKWLVRVGMGAMFTLLTFLLKSKLGW
jgi:hypothetical protein